VSTVSYSFYIDDRPPCQQTVVINQPAGTSTTYYYCNSVWYQPTYAGGDVKYVVTSPPAGGELATLVEPYSVTVDGKEYFVSNHVFYQRITRDGKLLYVTVDAPPGAKVPTIPQYAVEIEHKGQSYYRFDRIFYQRQGDAFVVVANPGV
jgi:hemin uptake protein HemP